MSGHLTDLIILILYLVALTAYGIYAGRKTRGTQEGYFLGGRKLTWVLIGSSLFATNISSTQVMGESGLGYKIGLSAASNDLMGAIMLGLSGVFFVPLYLRSRLYTVPEFLEQRFNRTSKLCYGWIFVLQGFLTSPIGFYAGGLALLGLFGIDAQYLWVACLAIGLSVGLYSVIGGLASVVHADFVQSIMMLLGMVVILVVGLSQVGGPVALWTKFSATSHFELMLPHDNPDLPWTAVFTGVALHSAFFAFCNVAILQRALGAKDLRNAQLGMVFGGFLKLSLLFLLALPGVIAVQLYPDAASDQVYSLMIRDLLPAGVSGLVLAGLLAALMSSADSGVVAVGSVVAMDIYPSFVKQPTERQSVMVGRVAGAAMMVFGALTAPLAAKMQEGIYLLALKTAGFMILPVGVCFLVGRFMRRVNHQGAVATLVTGLVLGPVYVLLTTLPALKPHMPAFLINAHFYHVFPILALVYAAVLVGVSACFPAPGPDKLAVLAARRDRTDNVPTGEEGLPMWKTFRFWLAGLLGTVGLLYVVF